MSKGKMSLEEIAEQPFHRGGSTDVPEPPAFDSAYAVRIWDAKNRVALNKMIAADPDSLHDSPDGMLHYVPHSWMRKNYPHLFEGLED